MDCGKRYQVAEYKEDIPPEMWERIAERACDRT